MIEQAPEMMKRVSDDMHRMVDYMGELRLVVMVMVCVCAVVGVCYLIFRCMRYREQQRKKKSELVHQYNTGKPYFNGNVSHAMGNGYSNVPDGGQYYPRHTMGMANMSMMDNHDRASLLHHGAHTMTRQNGNAHHVGGMNTTMMNGNAHMYEADPLMNTMNRRSSLADDKEPSPV
jgi:hypothetical protein